MEEFTYYGIVIPLKEFILRNVENEYGNKSDISIRNYISNNQYQGEDNIVNYPIINENNIEDVFLNCVFLAAIFEPFGMTRLINKEVIIGAYMGMNLTEEERDDLLFKRYLEMKHGFPVEYINYHLQFLTVNRIEGKDEIVYKSKL